MSQLVTDVSNNHVLHICCQQTLEITQITNLSIMTSYCIRHVNIGLQRFLVRFDPDYRFYEYSHSCAEPFPAVSILLSPKVAEILRD